MLRVHKIVAFSLEALLDSWSRGSESLNDALDVITFLHWDNSELIFLVDPNEKILGVVVENTYTMVKI